MIISFAVGLGMDENTTEDKDKIYKFLKSMDNNNDGSITKTDIINAKENFLYYQSGEVDCDLSFLSVSWEKLFRSIDLDGDDRADIHELYVASTDHSKILTQKNMDMIFRTLDYDKNK